MATDMLIVAADRIAERAHAGQLRKYTGEPYIVHPRAVADLVRTVPHTPAIVAAALLHDVLEDTAITADEIRAELGEEVTQLVFALTDQVPKSAGNRAVRKRLEAERLARTPSAAQTVKVADMIHNLESIVAHDRGFARIYVREMEYLLGLLDVADATLRGLAQGRLMEARRALAASARVDGRDSDGDGLVNSGRVVRKRA